MARVYSAQLGLVVGSDPAGSSLFVVPDGHRYVVRHITCSSTSTPLSDIAGFVIFTASGIYLWVKSAPGIAGNYPYDWSGRHVINAGDGLIITSRSSIEWNVLVSGYDLTLP